MRGSCSLGYLIDIWVCIIRSDPWCFSHYLHAYMAVVWNRLFLLVDGNFIFVIFRFLNFGSSIFSIWIFLFRQAYSWPIEIRFFVFIACPLGHWSSPLLASWDNHFIRFRSRFWRSPLFLFGFQIHLWFRIIPLRFFRRDNLLFKWINFDQIGLKCSILIFDFIKWFLFGNSGVNFHIHRLTFFFMYFISNIFRHFISLFDFRRLMLYNLRSRVGRVIIHSVILRYLNRYVYVLLMLVRLVDDRHFWCILRVLYNRFYLYILCCWFLNLRWSFLIHRFLLFRLLCWRYRYPWRFLCWLFCILC